MESKIHELLASLAQARRDLLRNPERRNHDEEFKVVFRWLNAQLPFAVLTQIETYLPGDLDEMRLLAYLDENSSYESDILARILLLKREIAQLEKRQGNELAPSLT